MYNDLALSRDTLKFGDSMNTTADQNTKGCTTMLISSDLSALLGGLHRKFRNFIKNRMGLYDIADLQIGEHCGCCGAWIPNEISPKVWAVGLCGKCKSA